MPKLHFLGQNKNGPNHNSSAIVTFGELNEARSLIRVRYEYDIIRTNTSTLRYSYLQYVIITYEAHEIIVRTAIKGFAVPYVVKACSRKSRLLRSSDRYPL